MTAQPPEEQDNSDDDSQVLQRSPFLLAGGMTALRAAAERMHISPIQYDEETAECFVDIHFTPKPNVSHPDFGETDLVFLSPSHPSFSASNPPVSLTSNSSPLVQQSTQVQSARNLTGIKFAPTPTVAKPPASVPNFTVSLQPDDVWLSRRRSAEPTPTPRNSPSNPTFETPSATSSLRKTKTAVIATLTPEKQGSARPGKGVRMPRCYWMSR